MYLIIIIPFKIFSFFFVFEGHIQQQLLQKKTEIILFVDSYFDLQEVIFSGIINKTNTNLKRILLITYFHY